MGKAFLVSVTLDTPLLMGNGFLTLDGVLAVAHEMLTGSPASPGDIPLEEESGVKKGSAAFFVNPVGVTSHTLFGRLQPHDLIDVDEQAVPVSRSRSRYQVIEQNSGKYKSHMTGFMKLVAERVCWFGVGDPDKVLDLIGILPGIGRKASLGYGRIENVEIESAPDCSWSLYGKPARPVPVELWSGAPADTALQAVSHPYWSSTRVPCVIPSRLNYKSNELDPEIVTP